MFKKLMLIFVLATAFQQFAVPDSVNAGGGGSGFNDDFETALSVSELSGWTINGVAANDAAVIENGALKITKSADIGSINLTRTFTDNE